MAANNGAPTVPSNAHWKERVNDKKSRVLASVPKQFIHEELQHSLEETASMQSVPNKHLTNLELEITAIDATGLIEAISSRKYTSVEVLNAFTHRAALAHKLLHCCLDIPYHLALARAQELDAHLAETGQTVGPLHGLPVSVKDQCRLFGTETTCGFIHPLGTLDTEDAVIVKLLKDAGAVIFAKTSLSMGCMWGETVNNMLGRASNPFNRSFSCGGSSGGEGGLIGFRASPLGVGSDLGGSIRSPSCYQGLYGLRPSAGRMPYFGMRNSMEGQLTIKSVCGPMSSSLDSIELFSKTIVDAKPWLHDPACQPIPWRSEIIHKMKSARKLRIGIFDWDNVCLPQPPIRNALKEVTQALEAAGHEVIPWKLDTIRAIELILAVFRSDAAGDIARQCAMSGEDVLENGCQTPNPPLTVLETWDLAVRCENFRADVLKQWAATAIEGKDAMDAYVSPVNPAVAPRHGDYSKVRYFAYTAVANVLDYSACTLPVRFVDPQIDLQDNTNLVQDARGELLPDVTCERDATIRRKYDPRVYEGLPVCLQVVGQRMEEEKVIGIVKMISRLIAR